MLSYMVLDVLQHHYDSICVLEHATNVWTLDDGDRLPSFSRPSRVHARPETIRRRRRENLSGVSFSITLTCYDTQVHKKQEEMSAQEQMLSDAIGTEPTIAKE